MIKIPRSFAISSAFTMFTFELSGPEIAAVRPLTKAAKRGFVVFKLASWPSYVRLFCLGSSWNCIVKKNVPLHTGILLRS